MNNFTFNENDSVQTMKQNLDNFILSLKKDKYRLILNFMNDLFDKKNKTLKTFKNMNYCRLEDDKITQTIEKYKNKIKTQLNITIKFDEDTDFSKQILKLVKNMMKTIDYSLSKSIYDKKEYYTVIDKIK